MTTLRKILHIVSLPSHTLAEIVIRTRGKKRTIVRIGVGLTLIGIGSIMATNPVEWCSHALWDGFAYFLHGFGSAPILSHLSTVFPIVLKDD